jgi:DNA polymerase type B, organellar and viral
MSATAAISFDDLNFEVPEFEEEKPKHKQLPIYTLDLETDPFLNGRYPEAFCAGLFTGTEFYSTWGENCVAEMHEIVKGLPPGIIYIHNGGRFDVFYLMRWVVGHQATIINSRVVKALADCHGGKHQIRDSYAIMPFALAKYKKDEIDYKLFEKDVRELHREKIVTYLKGDCVYLHELCSAFVEMWPNTPLTIGSTAMGELKKLHVFENLGPITDNDIRSKYYYGGRVECFKSGILRGNWNVFDVNSMYPYVMKEFLHPVEMPGIDTKKIRSTTCFLTVEGKNYGAFPCRTKTGLRFDIEDGIFHVTIHEWETALRYNLFEPRKIHRCVNFRNRSSFGEFIDTFYDRCNAAKAANDDIHTLFYKFVLRSSYGKFAQNPEHYYDYTISKPDADLRGLGWIPSLIPDVAIPEDDDFIVWKKRSKIITRYNVATAASITGGARALLMEGIAKAKNPIYCDTDSLICEDLPGVQTNIMDLGGWKLEATADKACIGGKKLYALFSSDQKVIKKYITDKSDASIKWMPIYTNEFGQPEICVKQANKGVALSSDEIQEVCNGRTVQSRRDAPSFKLDGSYNFISRKVRMTAN